MGKVLSLQEHRQRSIQLRNSRYLHKNAMASKAKQQKKYEAKLADKDKTIENLTTEIAKLKSELDKERMENAELKKMIFGEKPKDLSQEQTKTTKPKRKIPKKPRDATSYRRLIPDESKVTDWKTVRLDKICQCGGEVEVIDQAIRYVEDIPLPEITPDYNPLIVTKYLIEKGRCQACKEPKVAGNWKLAGQKVRLGPNIKKLICRENTGLPTSYQNTIDTLQDKYGIKISSGSIAKTHQPSRQQ